MFIACSQYKEFRHDVILIMDTEDCTLEYVPVDLITGEFIKEFNIQNICANSVLGRYFVAYRSILARKDWFTGGVVFDGKELRILDHDPITIETKFDLLKINDKLCSRYVGITIRYFFLYKDCTVFRCFYDTKDGIGKCTIVVGRDGAVEYYIEDDISNVRLNKSVIIQLELLGGDL